MQQRRLRSVRLPRLCTPPDGVLIVQQTTIAGKTDTNQIQIEKTGMRAETTRPMGGNRRPLRRSDAGDPHRRRRREDL